MGGTQKSKQLTTSSGLKTRGKYNWMKVSNDFNELVTNNTS